MTQERTEGPTPHGGAYAIAYYQDANGQPADKADAVAVEIIEYNADGVEVWRTYAEVAPK